MLEEEMVVFRYRDGEVAEVMLRTSDQKELDEFLRGLPCWVSITGGPVSKWLDYLG